MSDQDNIYKDKDPFTLINDAIYEMVFTPAVAALIRTGCRIKLPDSIEKEKHSTADTPEIKFEPAGGYLQPSRTYQLGECVQKFKITVLVGGHEIKTVYFPLKWAIYRALSRAPNNLGFNFVQSVKIDEGSENLESDKYPGWEFAIEIVVTMNFDKTAMQAGL
jgi:hypothetical protein